jgi:hypothetical protein
MPTISQFYGITIRMYFDDHPPPHFHAYYGDDAAKIDIDTLRVTEGKLKRRPLALVLEWADEHREELRENWRIAEIHGKLQPIAPLEYHHASCYLSAAARRLSTRRQLR